MIKLLRIRKPQQFIIPPNILNWENKIVTKELLLHFFSKVRSAAQVYNYDFWFSEIFLNSLKNLIPYLEVYPVNFNESSKIIDRSIALRNGLNEWELDILKNDVLQNINMSPNEKFENCWKMDKSMDNYPSYILGIKFMHPINSINLHSYYEFSIKIQSNNHELTISLDDYNNLIELIKIIFNTATSMYEYN